MITTEYLVPGLAPELAGTPWTLYAGRLWCATAPLARALGVQRDSAREQFHSYGPDDVQMIDAREAARLGFTHRAPRGQTIANLPAVCRFILSRDDLQGFDASVYRILDLAADVRRQLPEPRPTSPLGLMYADLYTQAWTGYESAMAYITATARKVDALCSAA
ncbi:hypothetical protein [Yinghuangia sp. YIM S09857]|uniref:hypothetical protein n=1 Tax=Yinghuangia sp. YIM S09857 TaxID=3436929 RepID=UPI003F52DF4F